MSERASRVFSLAEANELVPVVSDLTAKVVERLEGIRRRYSVDLGGEEPELPEPVLKEVEKVLQDWSEKVVEVGAHPKGFFTVDFQSLDPELLYCWTYGEDAISHTHKVWENFSHRRPLEESVGGPRDHLKWVN